MIFRMQQWCDEAAEALKGLIDPDVFPLLIQSIKNKSAVLWRVLGEGWQSWLITRVEVYPNGIREMVLEVIAGKNCKDILKRVFEVAKSAGVKSIRFETHHSEKVAMRFVGGLGFQRVATVFRVEL